MKKRIVSALQPTGSLHIGNYLGAVKQFVELQNEYDLFVFVADLHAITVPQNPSELRQKTIEVTRIYLAAGLDPEKCTLFAQSHISGHTQLSWVLSTLARMGDLEKMTQFKDKSAKESSERAGLGLFSYPVLMAADILLYDAALVPVGDDQLQHIELARTLARRFNDKFGETFVVPEAKIQKLGARIMSLDDPSKKMSKSAASVYNYIALTDDAETITKKIKKAVTDSGAEILYSEEKPALKNLIDIYALFDNKTPQEIVTAYQGKGYKDFKAGLTEVLVRELGEFQKRMADWDDAKVLQVLEDGAKKAKPLAVTKMQKVYEAVGFVSY
jgi:tryptophanyl-tRNA synthetase